MSACRACNWKHISEEKVTLFSVLATVSKWGREGAGKGGSAWGLISKQMRHTDMPSTSYISVLNLNCLILYQSIFLFVVLSFLILLFEPLTR